MARRSLRPRTKADALASTTSGRFERSIALPSEVEEDRAEASFKNGVLTIALPKSAKARESAKRIAINSKKDTQH